MADPLATTQENASAALLWGKVAIGMGMAGLTFLAWRWRGWWEMKQGRFNALAFVLLMVTRLGPFVLLYGFMARWPPSDVPSFYLPQAEEALNGRLVYRDFASSYGPAFPYILAGVLAIWHSTKAIALLAPLIEIASFPLWLAIARRLFDDRTVRMACLLYVGSGVVAYTNGVLGTNQGWLAACVALSWWLGLRSGEHERAGILAAVLSGMAAALGIIAVKSLGVLLAPVLYLVSRHRKAWVAGFVIPLAATFSLLWVLGADPFRGLESESHLISCGNLPFLMGVLGVDSQGPAGVVMMGLLGLALIVVFVGAAGRGLARSPQRTAHLVTLVMLLFMILSRKSYATYLAIFPFPLAITVACGFPGVRDWQGVVVAGLLSVLALVEQPLWFRWLDAKSLPEVRAFLTGVTSPATGPAAKSDLLLHATESRYWIMVACDALLVACYAVVAKRSADLIFRKGN